MAVDGPSTALLAVSRRSSPAGPASLAATAVIAASGMVTAIRCRRAALGDVVVGRKTARATAVAIPLRQQIAAPGTPGGDRAEAAGQEQLREHQIQVEDEADDVVRLVMPGDRAAGELHMVAAEQAGGHGEHAGALDETRRGAANVPGKLLAEPDRAAAEHQEAADHDPRIAGVRRREAAELDTHRAMPGLAQGRGDPGGSERHRAGHTGQRANSHTVRLGRSWPPGQGRRRTR